MCDHAIGRAKTVWYSLVISQQNFTDFDKRKVGLAQCIESLFHLIESGNETTQETSRFERGAYLCDVVVRIRHIEEEGVHVSFVEAPLNIGQFEVHAGIESETIQVFSSQILNVLFDFV